jgi:hypothetical protein
MACTVLVKSISKKGKLSLDFEDFLALVTHMQDLRLTFNAIDKDANGSIDHQVWPCKLHLIISFESVRDNVDQSVSHMAVV